MFSMDRRSVLTSTARRPSRSRSAAALLVVVAVTPVLAGCSQASDAAEGDGPRVATAFYPLQFVTQRLAGDVTTVESLTRPGLEPHDVELTPRQVGDVADADLVVRLAGFQPAVDEAVRTEARDADLDVSGAARLTAGGAEGTDPHFWLDPTRLADVSRAIEARLTDLDPAHADVYAANGTSLRQDLSDLDEEFRDGLANCSQRSLVTGHAAFGYLAERYGLEQVGVTGLDPEAEPSPRALAEVADYVRDHGVTTVYAETLVSPALARTIAGETGARTAVLDPVEAIGEASAGRDYLEVMRANLRALRSGQDCR